MAGKLLLSDIGYFKKKEVEIMRRALLSVLMGVIFVTKSGFSQDSTSVTVTGVVEKIESVYLPEKIKRDNLKATG